MGRSLRVANGGDCGCKVCDALRDGIWALNLGPEGLEVGINIPDTKMRIRDLIW